VDVGFGVDHTMGFDKDDPLSGLVHHPQNKIGVKASFLKKSDAASPT
jgi:hypothetical protein